MEGNGLTAVTSVFEALLTLITGSIAEFINVILANPFLLIGLGLMLVGAVVSFLKRLIHI